MDRAFPWGKGVGGLLSLLVLMGGGPPPASAQDDFPVVLSAGAHALTAPWYLSPVGSGFNPAFMVGTDHAIRSGNRWHFFYGVSLGFFRHRWWMTGVSLEPEIGVGHTSSGGFHADLRLGLGYMHYFWRRQTLELKNGEYVTVTDWGRPSLILPLSATLGYRGDTADPLSVSPFVAARWGVQGLFMEEVSVMTHFMLLGGVRIERGRDDTSGRR